VPEDRTKPHGRWLSLLVTFAPARTAAPAPDPTISIASELADDPATSPTRDHSQLITITTRLSGRPNPAMACPEFEPVTSQLMARPTSDPKLVAAGQRALRRCYDRLTGAGVALAHYTTEDAANDIVDLIRALHLSATNLVGVEETTTTALAVVRDYPSLVRSLTLQNPYPVAINSLDPTAQLASAFDAYVALCNADKKCARTYPNLGTTLRKDWANLNAHPQLITAADPNTGARHRILMTGNAIAWALASGLGSPIVDPLIPAALTNPPVESIAGVALSWNASYYEHNAPWGARLSLKCSHNLYTLSPGHTISSHSRPELAGIDDGTLQWTCAAWPVPKAPDSTFQGVASPTPTLLIVAPLDNQLSPQTTASLEADLPNINVLTLPTLGWSALQDGNPPCLNTLRRAFLTNPTQHLDTADCAKHSPPIKFAGVSP